MSGSSALRWGLWVQWVLASAVGAAAVALVVRPVSLWVGEAIRSAVGGVAAEIVVGLLAGGGVLLGIAAGQGFVLRGRVPWAGMWVLCSAVAGALGGATMLGLFEALGGTVGSIVAVIVGLSVFGIAQWLLLQGTLSWAAWLVAAGVLGLIVAGPSTGVAGALGFGAAYGAVTGIVLIWRLSV